MKAMKAMKAMSMLTEGKKVESIALDLGYANASAFINMFKRWMVYTRSVPQTVP